MNMKANKMEMWKMMQALKPEFYSKIEQWKVRIDLVKLSSLHTCAMAQGPTYRHYAQMIINE